MGHHLVAVGDLHLPNFSAWNGVLDSSIHPVSFTVRLGEYLRLAEILLDQPRHVLLDLQSVGILKEFYSNGRLGMLWSPNTYQLSIILPTSAGFMLKKEVKSAHHASCFLYVNS
jgi:hypothetical protein